MGPCLAEGSSTHYHHSQPQLYFKIHSFQRCTVSSRSFCDLDGFGSKPHSQKMNTCSLPDHRCTWTMSPDCKLSVIREASSVLSVTRLHYDKRNPNSTKGVTYYKQICFTGGRLSEGVQKHLLAAQTGSRFVESSLSTHTCQGLKQCKPLNPHIPLANISQCLVSFIILRKKDSKRHVK